ncbi:MAG: hypothetical protein K2I90_12175 [Odoribacter sp.]|nr:hypothetical protein [Odoribacter sp.]
MLLFKILLALLPFFPQTDNWQRVQTDEKISFLLPNVPQKTKEIIQGIPSSIYVAKDLTCIAGVVCSDLSPKKVQLTEETALLFYEGLKNSTMNIENAMIKRESTVPYENMLIKEIEYTIIKDDYEMTYFKRFIFRENYIYQIVIGGRTRHSEILKKEKDIFFNSVSFLPDAEKKN